MFPPDDELKICFAHVAYQLRGRFLLRQAGIDSFGGSTPDEFTQRIGEADVVVVLSHLGFNDGGYNYGLPVYGDKTLAQRLIDGGKTIGGMSFDPWGGLYVSGGTDNGGVGVGGRP